MDCKERILSNDYADGVVDFPIEDILEEGDDACYIKLSDRFYTAYANRSLVPDFAQSPFQYPYIPKLYGLMEIQEGTGDVGRYFDPSALVSSGIRQLQGAPLDLRGQGVIIAIIDTGIDYQNAAFLDENGESRILAIWDQTIQEGTPPQGFYFGTEYRREKINQALEAEDPLGIVPVTDPLRHGSIMAGLAAGSLLDGGATYIGAAPQAELVVVKLKECKPYLREYFFIPRGVPAYEENDIMLGVAYANRFAEEFERPVVICLGVGTNMGDHAGNSFLGKYLNDIASLRSRAVIVCGGNEGIANHHYSWRFPVESETIPYRDVEIRVGEGVQGFLAEFWGSVPDIFNISIRSPGGEVIPPIRLGIEQRNTYSFIFEDTIITIQSVLVEPGAGEEFIQMRFQAPTAGIWTLRILTVGEVHNGTFHIWLPITEFLGGETYFLEADPDTTLTEPAMAGGVISVSTYHHRENRIFLESGRGFSRTGQIRPDLAAPGVDVPTLYGNRTGSSLAAAITAGGVAQFMQWAVVEGNSPLAETAQVKNYFVKGAVRQNGRSYPNREWGYGTLNVLGVFERLRTDV